jgi:hypothetical protein
MYANHNRCVDLSRADWIIFLHSDDVLNATCLSTYSSIINTTTDLSTLGFAFGKQDHLGTSLSSDELISFPASLMFFLRKGGVTPSGTLFSKDALISIEGFDNDPQNLLAEDWVYRLTAAGYGFLSVDCETTVSRKNSTFPRMMASGATHLGARLTFKRLFNGIDDDSLLNLIINDINNWADVEVAVFLRKLAQAEKFEYVRIIERFLGYRIKEISRQKDYWHVRATKWLRKGYWPLLMYYKKLRSLPSSMTSF